MNSSNIICSMLMKKLKLRVRVRARVRVRVMLNVLGRLYNPSTLDDCTALVA